MSYSHTAIEDLQRKLAAVHSDPARAALVARAIEQSANVTAKATFGGDVTQDLQQLRAITLNLTTAELHSGAAVAGTWFREQVLRVLAAAAVGVLA